MNKKAKVNASILIIGNEILSGRTQDTNTSTLAIWLNSIGVNVAEVRVIPDIEKTIVNFGKQARDGNLTIQDMSNGTFTISNGGVYGSMLSSPILNPPQSGILGMHNIQKRAVVIDDKVEIRSMMYLALSYDHRIIDGREAVSFLVNVKENLEDPQRMLIGV